MPKAFQSRLTLRLGAALATVTVAVLAAAGLWNLRLQRAHLTRATAADAVERADDIVRATREAMLRNDPGEIRRIIAALALQPRLERIRLIDAQGQVRLSSHAAEIGSRVDRSAAPCVSCHTRDGVVTRPPVSERARLFSTTDGRKVLGVVSPILNEPSCAAAGCHAQPASQSVLGMLDLRVSLADMEASLAASRRQMLLGFCGALVALLLLVWLLVWQMVLRPVNRLTAAARRVAVGELSAHIPIETHDEIGQMTEAWNSMIARLGRAQIVLQRWSQDLEESVALKTAELETAHRRMLVVEKMASLGKLAATVAHEINNPLTGVGTYARLLRRRHERGGASREETERILGLIEEEAVRCGEIVRGLLVFSRASEESFAPIELDPVLGRCRMLLRHPAKQRSIGLELDIEDGLPRVEGNGSQIEQMILALAQNAIEATAAGGTVTIAARHDAGGDAVVLEISDPGRGIPAELLAEIYEPFFTTKEEGGGIGLGLAVVYGIVQRHHGSIDVESQPGSGSVFTVRLPRRQPATETTQKARTDEAITGEVETRDEKAGTEE